MVSVIKGGTGAFLLPLLLLLMLLLFIASAPRRHNVRLASATDFPGNVERVDRGSCSVVPKISKLACRLPLQPSQCSTVCGASSHFGQFGLTDGSTRCLYARRWLLWPDLSCANNVASLLDMTAAAAATILSYFVYLAYFLRLLLWSLVPCRSSKFLGLLTPIFLQWPFLIPNQQCQSTEENDRDLSISENLNVHVTVVFWQGKVDSELCFEFANK